MTAFFLSDLHLARAAGPVFDCFARFLGQGPARGDRVYILGDLFDAWAGDDDLDDPDNAAVTSALGACAERGVELHWIAGNRDFLAGPDYLAATRMQALPEPSTLELFGERTVLCHGDLLCTDDADYQAWRTRARDPAWQRAFLDQPLPERKALIAGMRSQSEREKAAKSAAIMDVNAAAVERLFIDSGATRLIHGHTHRPGRHVYSIDAVHRERWVLPAWEDAPGCLIVDRQGARLSPLQ